MAFGFVMPRLSPSDSSNDYCSVTVSCESAQCVTTLYWLAYPIRVVSVRVVAGHIHAVPSIYAFGVPARQKEAS